MPLCNFRKESSERSDGHNWAKRVLRQLSGIYFESIEGCNQNGRNQVTHLLERARVDYLPDGKTTKSDVLRQILELETYSGLSQKINFANQLGLPLNYVLYCNELERVFLFQVPTAQALNYIDSFGSYPEFSRWLAYHKGWKSSKPYRQIEDLPYFDKALRQAGCAWPTNIDCFVSNVAAEPLAIIEFQNADKVSVRQHCNNNYFLCKLAKQNAKGRWVFQDDIRRWLSQEILRLQSGLRYFIITWATNSDNFTIKELAHITFPYFPHKANRPDWENMKAYKLALHHYSNGPSPKNKPDQIAKTYCSYRLIMENGQIEPYLYTPPLSLANHSFPQLYYAYNHFVAGNPDSLPTLFAKLLSNK